MKKNKSAPYGYYGGVTQENHYVPPPVADFVPQPASTPFYEDYRLTLIRAITSVGFTEKFLMDNAGSIMFRTAEGLPYGAQQFTISTPDHPNDKIEYDTLSGDDVDLMLLDGGTF
jgi:hypothetical protein